jgi:hypothetical protein
MLWSEQFDNAAWDKRDATISANQTTSPDGTQNADKFIPINGTQTSWVLQDFSPSAGVYTYSMYVKSSDFSFVQITGSVAFANEYQNYNIANGTLASYSGAQGSIQSMGNGWYRLIYTLTATASGPARFILTAQDSGTAGRLDACTGNGTKFISIWGAQLEVSSYATSYIGPTTSASATRVADLSTSSTIQTAQTFAGDFTIFADFVPFIDSTDANGLMILGGGASGLGATYKSYLWFSGSNVYLSGDGEVIIIQRGYSMVVNQRVKIAFTRVGTTVKMFVNGAQVGASATSSTSITIRSIGWSYNLPTYQTKGKINQVVLSATGFSDADCQSLTTI